MHHLYTLFAAHKVAAGVIAWIIGSAAIDGMPKPDKSCGRGYCWLYACLNLLAANAKRVAVALLPQFARLVEDGPKSSSTGE